MKRRKFLKLTSQATAALAIAGAGVAQAAKALPDDDLGTAMLKPEGQPVVYDPTYIEQKPGMRTGGALTRQQLVDELLPELNKLFGLEP